MTKWEQKSLLTPEMAAEAAIFENAVEMANNMGGRFIGYGAWANYLSLGIDNVGTVISTFNLFDTALVAAIRLEKAGFTTVANVGTPVSDELVRCARNIQGIWMTVFGKLQAEGTKYETALKYDNVVANHNGMEYVKVELVDVKACFERAANIAACLPLADVIAFCRDAEAIKRFYGEYTIDATKKPEDFLREKPFFDYMKNVAQRGRKELSVSVDRKGNRVVVEGAELGVKVGENGQKQKLLTVVRDKSGKVVEREDGRGYMYRFDCVDLFQEVRAEAAEYLRELGELCLQVPVQKLPSSEMAEIKAVKDKMSKTVMPAIALQKEIWMSMSAAIQKQRRELENKYGKKSYEVEQHIKDRKQHNNVCYAAVTNNVRRLFELAGVNDAVVRVRCLLAVVMGNLQTVKWAELSDFAHSVLPEEWFIYTMTMMKGDRFTPDETMDEVSFIEELTDEELAGINGKKVTFTDGMLVINGVIIAVANGVDLNGEFVLRVTDNGVFACHDIVSLVEVPKADSNTTVFVTKADVKTAGNVDYILDSVIDSEVTLAPYQKDAILVNKNGNMEKVGEFRCSYNGKNLHLLNSLYGNKQGVTGTVVEAVEGVYEEEGKGRKRIVVFVMKNTVETPDELAEAVVPDKTVAIEEKKPVITVETADFGLTF